MTQLGNIKGEPFHNGVFETKGAQYSSLSSKASLERPNHRWYDLTTSGYLPCKVHPCPPKSSGLVYSRLM
jgi:hypothetical protein